jgi:hypothetical protein
MLDLDATIGLITVGTVGTVVNRLKTVLRVVSRFDAIFVAVKKTMSIGLITVSTVVNRL